MNEIDFEQDEKEDYLSSFEAYEAHHNQATSGDGVISDDDFANLLNKVDTKTKPKAESAIWRDAASENKTAAQYIVDKKIDCHNLAEKRWWLEPSDSEDGKVYVSDVDLIGETNSPLVEMCKGLAGEIQFPLQTAYLHGLGVIASLAVRKFKIKYGYETIPANLYVVTAQPPSSGKSGINNGLTGHARIVFADKNAKNAPVASMLAKKIEDKQKEINKCTNQHEVTECISEMQKLTEQFQFVAPYRYGLNDATPEAAEDLCSKQGGVFSIVSAESFAIKTMLGDIYSNNGTANQNVFLSAWDGEFVSSVRMTRTGHDGFVSASIAVLAQDSTFDSILDSAGSDSCGVPERFLLLREPNMFGNRKSATKVRQSREVRENYKTLVENIIEQGDITLEFDNKAELRAQLLGDYYDDCMAKGQRYSSSIMQGVAGKSDKQIKKIAAILHIVDNWKAGGSKSHIITQDYIQKGFNIFKQCLRVYETITDSRGVAGQNTSKNIVNKKLKAIINDKAPKFSVKFSSLRDQTKNLKELKREGFSDFLRDSILSELESDGAIVYDKKAEIIHINPHLRD